MKGRNSQKSPQSPPSSQQKVTKSQKTVVDPGGSAAGACPPYGSRFFRFDIQIFRNVAASGVGAPPYEVGTPPMGNPGSATGRDAMAVVMTCINIGLKIVQHGVQHAENVTNPIIGKLCAVKSHENPLKEGNPVPW